MKVDKVTNNSKSPERKMYVYLGDKNSDSLYKNKECEAVFNTAGKCIRGRNGTMLVSFEGRKVVVLGRRLRKLTEAIKQPKKL